MHIGTVSSGGSRHKSDNLMKRTKNKVGYQTGSHLFLYLKNIFKHQNTNNKTLLISVIPSRFEHCKRVFFV